MRGSCRSCGGKHHDPEIGVREISELEIQEGFYDASMTPNCRAWAAAAAIATFSWPVAGQSDFPHVDRVLTGRQRTEHFEVRFQELSERKTRVFVKYLGTLGGKEMRGWLRLGKEAGGETIASIQITGHDITR